MNRLRTIWLVLFKNIEERAKEKKSERGYSLFRRFTLSAAIAESNPINAINPTGVSAGTCAGVGGPSPSGHSSNGSLSVLFAVPSIEYGPDPI